MSTLSIPNNVVTLTTISSTAYNADTAAIEAWANGNIDDDNLLNDGITASLKIKNNTIDQAAMGLLSVGTPELIDDAVISEKIGFSGALVFALDYDGTGRVSGVIYENTGDATLTLTKARLTASTAPVDATEEISVVKLGTGYTDPDTGGTAVTFTTSNPDLLTTVQRGAERVASTGNTLAPGEAWVFDVISVGSTTPAGEVTIHLEVHRGT